MSSGSGSGSICIIGVVAIGDPLLAGSAADAEVHVHVMGLLEPWVYMETLLRRKNSTRIATTTQHM